MPNVIPSSKPKLTIRALDGECLISGTYAGEIILNAYSSVDSAKTIVLVCS